MLLETTDYIRQIAFGASFIGVPKYSIRRL